MLLRAVEVHSEVAAPTIREAVAGVSAIHSLGGVPLTIGRDRLRSRVSGSADARIAPKDSGG